MKPESSESSPRIDARTVLWVAAVALLTVAGFLSASAFKEGSGFPLDDAWIHATYARNLALYGDWAFQVGQPSAGSTAPLWTILLAGGHFVGLAPLWWNYLLGYAALVGLGITAEWLFRGLVGSYRPRLPWTGIFIVAEWHLVWAAASGMETLFYALLVTAALGMLSAGRPNHVVAGLLVGLSLWIRPDGLTLIGPTILAAALASNQRATLLRRLSAFVLAFGAFAVPYLAFNLRLSGTPMPNTFYAKQAEYAAWQARPLLDRFAQGFLQVSAGPMLLLWPGLVAAIVGVVRGRQWAAVGVIGWAAGYMLLYLLRLPAYQHGRYLMPAMPILFVYGLAGFSKLRADLAGREWGWAIGWAWKSGLALLTASFVVLGARAYAADVALIESEMVDTARWVEAQIPAEAVVAAHDIGALGYFDNHELLDLAGLASPEVVPFIRDEVQLAEYLDRRGADYLVAFPGLYPQLAAVSLPVHESGGPFAPEGQGNMTVYCWRCR